MTERPIMSYASYAAKSRSIVARVLLLTIGVGFCTTFASVQSAVGATPANVMTELTFESSKEYADPFNQVQLDVVFVDPARKEFRVPAFWDGGKTWHVRYSSALTGIHRYETRCSDPSNAGLQKKTG